ncbi:MAG: dTMP kinase [Anaerovoracaceae bacterium]
MNGIFITFEGTDASGKTTQIGLLSEYLEKKGVPHIVTREPGGTAIGEKIRTIILDKENSEMLPATEALLYAASRAQLTGQVVRPALREGKVVISDRFLDSSIAYQGYGRNLGDMIRRINEPAVEGLKPDLTILLKTDPAAMRKRRDASLEDRMDSQKLEFHREVLRGYLTLSQEEPERFFVIDGERPVDEIAKAIRERVDRFVWK